MDQKGLMGCQCRLSVRPSVCHEVNTLVSGTPEGKETNKIQTKKPPKAKYSEKIFIFQFSLLSNTNMLKFNNIIF